MLDKELCEDIKFLYNYDITKKEKKVDNENVYELADDIIKKQVEEVKMYQDLSKTKLEELELKLKKASKEYVDEFAIVVENKNVLKNDFINGLHEQIRCRICNF